MVRLSREAVPKRLNSREGLYGPLLRLLLYDTTAIEFWMSKSLLSHEFVIQFRKIKRDKKRGSCFCPYLGMASYLAAAFKVSKIGKQSNFSPDCFENIAQNTVRYLYTEQLLSWFQPFWDVLSLRNSIGFFFQPNFGPKSYRKGIRFNVISLNTLRNYCVEGTRTENMRCVRASDLYL